MTATLESPAPARAPRTFPWLTVWRFVLVAAATVVAFWNLWHELIEDIAQRSDIGYVFALPILAGFAAIGMALRHHTELPIYDRQTDIIVGLLGLAGTAALIGLLVLRYPYEYEVLHLDLVAAPLFLMSVCILAFGLRPVFRFWPVWLLVLVCASPLLYRILTVTIGGTKPDQGLVMLIPAAAAAAIGSGRTRLRALAGGAIALAVGALMVAVMAVWFPQLRGLWFQLVPPIVASYVATTVMYFFQRRWRTVRPLDRRVRPSTATWSRSALATVIVSTALMALIPVPEEYRPPAPLIPGLVIADAPQVAGGWQLVSEHEYPWAPRYYGRGNRWMRQQWQTVRGNPLWDKESRRRRIMVDVLRADYRDRLDHYPEFVMYGLDQPRISPPLRIDLGHGVVGRLNAVVDDRNLLSWTWLTWTWQGADGAERVSLISADNHLRDAVFPRPDPSVRKLLSNQLHAMLRGNAVILDPESPVGDPESEYKDRDMLTAVAQEIVRNGAGE
ncbi:hypothetical protein [Nocardia sp. NBC_00511]|uniref:hypothetical protein n=1 Tax=Nocardia sp. NBC_00511 TaxID=2903591 RepID=UPI0030DE15EF